MVQGIPREEKTQTGKSLLLLNNRPAAWGSVCEETAAAGIHPRQPEERGKRLLSSLVDGDLSGW